MAHTISTILFVICIIFTGCTSMQQVATQTDDHPKFMTTDKSLESKLIEDYLAYADIDEMQQEEEKVVIYNTKDELEFQGTAEDTNARILMLKGDFLFDMDNLYIYRINK